MERARRAALGAQGGAQDPTGAALSFAVHGDTIWSERSDAAPPCEGGAKPPPDARRAGRSPRPTFPRDVASATLPHIVTPMA